MDVSIIIVNYNTKNLTLNCLKAIFDHTKGIDFEVILVDNASSDGSCVSIKTQFPQVKVIESKENIGFGRANNLGFKNAIGEFLFLLNSDTILLNNAVLQFVSFFKSNKEMNIGALGAVLLSPDLQPIHSSSNFPLKRNTIKNILIHYFNKKYFQTNYRKERLYFGKDVYFAVDSITGADLFIPKSVFETIGGFDSNYFMYFEETDLQKRLQKSNYFRLIINGPEIIHMEGASNKSLIYNASKRILVGKSMFYYFKTHSNVISYVCFRVSYGILRLPIIIDQRIPLQDRLTYIKSLWTFE